MLTKMLAMLHMLYVQIGSACPHPELASHWEEVKARNATGPAPRPRPPIAATAVAASSGLMLEGAGASASRPAGAGSGGGRGSGSGGGFIAALQRMHPGVAISRFDSHDRMASF